MSGSSSASSDDEQDPSQGGVQKTQRKKSSTKRSLDLQRKISLSKLREEKKETKLRKNKVLDHSEFMVEYNINSCLTSIRLFFFFIISFKFKAYVLIRKFFFFLLLNRFFF